MSVIFSLKPKDLEEKPTQEPTRKASDRAKNIALVMAMVISMAGWLWFLGWIVFRFFSWIAGLVLS